MEASIDVLERAKEYVEAGDLVFRREWLWVMCSFMAWGMFWDVAERHQGAHGQFITWLTVFLAWWVVGMI